MSSKICVGYRDGDLVFLCFCRGIIAPILKSGGFLGNGSSRLVRVCVYAARVVTQVTVCFGREGGDDLRFKRPTGNGRKKINREGWKKAAWTDGCLAQFYSESDTTRITQDKVQFWSPNDYVILSIWTRRQSLSCL